MGKLNWSRAVGSWKHASQLVSARWTKLSETQLQGIAGRRGRLGEQICRSYGVGPSQAERQIRRFETDIGDFESLE